MSRLISILNLVIISMIIPVAVMAQKAPKIDMNTQGEVPDEVRAFHTMRDWSLKGTIVTGDIMRGLKPPPPEVIGDYYLHTDWKEGNVLLFQDNMTIEGYPLKYDIYNDLLEIETEEGVKVIEGYRVKSFVWRKNNGKPTYFLSARNYRSETEEISGFFEVLVDGEMPLFLKTNIRVKEPHYYEGIDVGSRDYEIVKDKEYYYASGRVVEALSRNKKGLLLAFADKEEEMASFFKQNKISFKDEGDLMESFMYYNKLKNN
ncbi:MAG: hypothetical protein RIC80_09555 [Cyclobacteriaceae bacterium]